MTMSDGKMTYEHEWDLRHSKDFYRWPNLNRREGMNHNKNFKKIIPSMKVKIKKGWEDEGREGIKLGDEIYVKQNWTPVLWDNEEDPTFCKSAGLEPSTKRRR